VTARNRKRHERNKELQNPALPSEGRAPAAIGTWLDRGDHVRQPGVVWLKRPMPPDQWPPDLNEPRDNSLRWWVRANCGHRTRQFAFYEERYADVYELVFRDAPCWWTRCGADRPVR
jgi:hypothetical protein